MKHRPANRFRHSISLQIVQYVQQGAIFVLINKTIVPVSNFDNFASIDEYPSDISNSHIWFPLGSWRQNSR